ncbi:MAG: phage late control D family protein [Candidatus Binataceae bacterium]
MSALTAWPVRSPQWMLTYSGTDITSDISRMVTEVRYTDFLGGRASEVEVAIDDGAKRWQGPWYPSLGAKVSLFIGYGGETLMPCGDFEIDQIELDGPPDAFRLRCLSAYVTPAMRTRTSRAYENQSLLGIAGAIARRYGLTVVGATDPGNLAFTRVTQKNETDLAFLKRLAAAYDYCFSVRGGQLVFYARSALEAQAPVMTIARRDTERFSFENLTRATYQGAQVAYQDPSSKQLLIGSAQAATIPAGDTLKLSPRVENQRQAVLRAGAELAHSNRRFLSARILTPGTTALLAGNTIALSGWGAFDAAYLIESAHHRLSRAAGYTTEIEVRRVDY